MAAHYLSVEQVEMTFETKGATTNVLHEINLSVQRGEYISIIGHSGCGKSTLLNIIAGLTESTSGAVILDGKEVNAPGPDRSVVFQNHSLLPWLTVYENVSLAVNKTFARSKSKAERHEWILKNLDMVGMSHALDKRPAEISGGMKQRVGIARALSMEPKVLLLDEPFGALDALTRAHLQEEVMRIQDELGNTVIMITHDVDEAVLLSDRIVMLTNGPSARIGEILDIDLPRPRNRIELADDPNYNRYRQEVLRFLYEKQRKVENLAERRGKTAPASATKKVRA
ncbi:MAG: ABC transporter ATP-binding protein [Halomonas sp.]|nr:ABC transporter ATP-binding protein [Halomonas sp.]TVP42594.1 MAG: ABC transporter ATP-binding protein [Halomonas sp.]